MKFSDVESDAKKYGISVQGYNNAHNMVNMYNEAVEELKMSIQIMEDRIEFLNDEFSMALESEPQSVEGHFESIHDDAVRTLSEKFDYFKNKFMAEYNLTIVMKNKALNNQSIWETNEQNELTSISNAIDAKKAAEEQARIAAEQAQKANQNRSDYCEECGI